MGGVNIYFIMIYWRTIKEIGKARSLIFPQPLGPGPQGKHKSRLA